MEKVTNYTVPPWQQAKSGKPLRGKKEKGGTWRIQSSVEKTGEISFKYIGYSLDQFEI